jgi:hypothetical protein
VRPPAVAQPFQSLPAKPAIADNAVAAPAAKPPSPPAPRALKPKINGAAPQALQPKPEANKAPQPKVEAAAPAPKPVQAPLAASPAPIVQAAPLAQAGPVAADVPAQPKESSLTRTAVIRKRIAELKKKDEAARSEVEAAAATAASETQLEKNALPEKKKGCFSLVLMGLALAMIYWLKWH